MKLETRLRLESDFDKKLKDKINAIHIAGGELSYNDKEQELISYVRLQVSLAYKLGVKAGKGEEAL